MHDFKQDKIQNNSEEIYYHSEKMNNSDLSQSKNKSSDSPNSKSKVSTKISMIESKGGLDISHIVKEFELIP